jgi:hypothetical protein
LNTREREMNSTNITRGLTSVLNPRTVTNIAKKCGFMQRMRKISPLDMVLALINTLGTRQKVNIADIHKQLCTAEGKDICYKPFHNKLRKPQLTSMLKKLTEEAAKEWLIKPVSQALPEAYPFKAIEAHDGSSLKLHIGLKGSFPGRFTKTHPSAMELHMTMDLMSGCYNYLGISPDSESEHHHKPFPHEIEGILLLMDAGYFDINYCDEVDRNGGFTIMRTNGQINPNIEDAYNDKGKPIKRLIGQKIKQIKLKKNTLTDLTVSWKHKQGKHRIIAFWDKKKSRIGYLITNLKREQFSAKKVCELYGLRWQIELFFKELKSYSGLKTFNTRDKFIAESLVWASMLTLLLKRFMAWSSGRLYQVLISSQSVARSAPDWLKEILGALSIGKTHLLQAMVTKWCRYLAQYASRAHPKRDEETLFVQLMSDSSILNPVSK